MKYTSNFIGTIIDQQLVLLRSVLNIEIVCQIHLDNCTMGTCILNKPAHHPPTSNYEYVHARGGISTKIFAIYYCIPFYVVGDVRFKISVFVIKNMNYRDSFRFKIKLYKQDLCCHIELMSNECCLLLQ